MVVLGCIVVAERMVERVVERMAERVDEKGALRCERLVDEQGVLGYQGPMD